MSFDKFYHLDYYKIVKERSGVAKPIPKYNWFETKEHLFRFVNNNLEGEEDPAGMEEFQARIAKSVNDVGDALVMAVNDWHVSVVMLSIE